MNCVTFGVLLSLFAPQFPTYFKVVLPCFWENCEEKYISVSAFLNGAIAERGESWSVVVAQKKSHCLSLCPNRKLLTSMQYR